MFRPFASVLPKYGSGLKYCCVLFSTPTPNEAVGYRARISLSLCGTAPNTVPDGYLPGAKP
jgi:hypothetical protein